jgi:hypothetical protein
MSDDRAARDPYPQMPIEVRLSLAEWAARTGAGVLFSVLFAAAGAQAADEGFRRKRQQAENS